MTAKSLIYKTSNFPPLMVAPEDETLALMSRQLLEFLTIPHCYSSDGESRLWDQGRIQKQLGGLDEKEIGFESRYSELDKMEQDDTEQDSEQDIEQDEAEIRGIDVQIESMNKLNIGDIDDSEDEEDNEDSNARLEERAETNNELFEELTKTDIQLSAIGQQGWDDDKLWVLENGHNLQCPDECKRISEDIMRSCIRRRQRMRRMVQMERAWDWQHRKKLIKCGLESLSSDLLEGDDESRLVLHAAKIREDIQTAQMLKKVVQTRMELHIKLNKQEKAHKDQLRGKMREALAEKRSQRGLNKK